MPGIADFLRGMFMPQQPPMAEAPMNAPQPMNPLAALTQWNTDNPGVLSSIGAGMMQGDMGGGFAQAGQYRALAQGKQQERAEKTRTTNLTRNWLMKQGISDADADAAMANPAILSQMMKGEQRQSLLNTSDGIYDPNTGEWINNPNAAGGQAKAPQVVELFDETTGQPYKAIWDGSEYKRVGGIKARAKTRFNPETGVMEDITDGDPSLKEYEGKNSGFYLRASESNKLVDNLEGEATLGNKLKEAVPFGIGNFMKSDEAQQFEQAKRNFVNALLRRESGAVISEQEFDNADKQYFPQPGDSDAVKQQKAANRRDAIEGLRVSSGQGANLVRPQGGAQGNRTSSGVSWTIEP